MTPLADAIKYNLKLAPIPKKTVSGKIVLNLIASDDDKAIVSEILSCLAKKPYSTIDLANELLYAVGTISGVMNRLKKQGLVDGSLLDDGGHKWRLVKN